MTSRKRLGLLVGMLILGAGLALAPGCAKKSTVSQEETTPARTKDIAPSPVSKAGKMAPAKEETIAQGQMSGGAGAPATPEAVERKLTEGDTSSSLSVDDQLQYAETSERRDAGKKEKSQNKPGRPEELANEGLGAAVGSAIGEEVAPVAQSRVSPPAHAPAPEPASPFARLKVVNDKPFHDMYFKHYGVNPTIDTEEEPFSTFAVDVDTASYTMARSYLDRGHLPEEDAIRVEEFVNAFDYGYTPPSEEAFGLHAEAFPSPSRRGYHLLHIGIKGREVKAENRKPANLVFVVDTSGSMETENRLGLVKKGLGYLVDQLHDDDTVGIVAYGSHAYEVLRPTSGREKSSILRALNDLYPTGSTNAQAGIHMGYAMAASVLKKGGINRIILCSDGVANNGVATGADGIFQTVKDKADMGITISTIGFGMGNYNDTLMERLADQGDGNYYYVDREEETRRVFVENLTGMLQVIAKDVKIQMEFDKDTVARYRLLGYENRGLKKEDFANDRIDAGEIGAGHSVTAIYEVKFTKKSGDLGTLRIRYKKPEGGASTLIERRLSSEIVRVTIEKAPPYARLAMVAAAFAEKLRGSYWARNIGYDQIQNLHGRIGGQLAGRKDVVELGDMITRAKGLDRREDKFEKEAPLAMMDFDNLPVTR
ncbi:MAG: von Willebrand factor type A domain-containing protein [Nitrospinota bacterium]|nr:von Willebrand factor type A domain-containing protein [Nitrospinota bacterium]